jgi:predicted nucleotide-binding protein
MAADDKPMQHDQWARIVQEVENSGEIHEWEAKAVVKHFASLVPRGFWFRSEEVQALLKQCDLEEALTQQVVSELAKENVLLTRYLAPDPTNPLVLVKGPVAQPSQRYHYLSMERKSRETYKKWLDTAAPPKVTKPPLLVLPVQGTPFLDLNNPAPIPAQVPSKDIFVVHGHDEEMKQAAARTFAQLGLSPTILHEQPNKGRTVIEKFLDESHPAGFAVVLLSPDDKAFSRDMKPAKAKFRARQNVILELGFFVGKLGRDKVCVLYRHSDNFELPSDYLGALYVPYDSNGAWRYKLADELNAAGYGVDKNKLS